MFWGVQLSTKPQAKDTVFVYRFVKVLGQVIYEVCKRAKYIIIPWR